MGSTLFVIFVIFVIFFIFLHRTPSQGPPTLAESTHHHDNLTRHHPQDPPHSQQPTRVYVCMGGARACACASAATGTCGQAYDGHDCECAPQTSHKLVQEFVQEVQEVSTDPDRLYHRTRIDHPISTTHPVDIHNHPNNTRINDPHLHPDTDPAPPVARGRLYH